MKTIKTEVILSIVAITISVGSLFFTHFHRDFTTTAFFSLVSVDKNNKSAKYEVKIINRGNRLVILERINKFIESKSKRKINNKRLNEESLIIQPNEVVTFNVDQSFENHEGLTKFGSSFQVLTTDGNAILSSVVIGQFNNEDPSKFRMAVSNLNLITNKAIATIYHGDRRNGDVISKN